MRRITQIALLGAIAFLFLHFLEIPRGLFQPYLKYDPSDIPALIATFAFGPLAGIGVEAVKAVLVGLAGTPGGPFGVFMNFLAGASLAGVAGAYYLVEHTRLGAIKGLILGVLAMTAVMVIANIALTPIFYGIPRPTVLGLVVPALIPFNVVKGALSALVTYFVYRRVRVYLYERIGERVAW